MLGLNACITHAQPSFPAFYFQEIPQGTQSIIPHKGQKRSLDPLELELQVIVSHYVGAENQTQVFARVFTNALA